MDKDSEITRCVDSLCDTQQLMGALKILDKLLVELQTESEYTSELVFPAGKHTPRPTFTEIMTTITKLRRRIINGEKI